MNGGGNNQFDFGGSGGGGGGMGQSPFDNFGDNFGMQSNNAANNG